MSLVKTQNLELSIYEQGDVNATKFALVLPGKLDTKDYAHMHSHVEYLAIRGYHAVSFDPPGTWESPGDIKHYTMTNYLKAINELIEYFGNKPTFVMGHSRGASMSILAATTNSKVVGFAPIMSSFTNGGYMKWGNEDEWKKDGYKIEFRDLPPGGGSKVKEYHLPYSFYEDQLQYDMTDDLRNCPKPKLFIYGSQDELAKPEVVKEMYKLASEPKDIYELSSGHDYRHHANLIEEVNTVVGNFLDQHDL